MGGGERDSMDDRYGSNGFEYAVSSPPRLDRRDRRDNVYLGEHTGKGPKGYQRSDSRILEDLQEELARDGSIDASEIDVKIANGEVTLTGTVSSKQQKRDAEDCAESVFGVQEVHNQLRVTSSRRSGVGGLPASRDLDRGVNAT